MVRKNLSNDDKARNEVGKKYNVSFNDFLINNQLPPSKVLNRLLLNFIIRNQGKAGFLYLDKISPDIYTLLVNQLGETRLNLKSHFLLFHQYLKGQPLNLNTKLFSGKEVYEDFIELRKEIRNNSFYNIISSSDTSLRSVPLGATFNALKYDRKFI
ncbi:MAG: hypothetical protein R2879_21730 [Saprospiraceae bacterium]